MSHIHPRYFKLLDADINDAIGASFYQTYANGRDFHDIVKTACHTMCDRVFTAMGLDDYKNRRQDNLRRLVANRVLDHCESVVADLTHDIADNI